MLSKCSKMCASALDSTRADIPAPAPARPMILPALAHQSERERAPNGAWRGAMFVKTRGGKGYKSKPRSIIPSYLR